MGYKGQIFSEICRFGELAMVPWPVCMRNMYRVDDYKFRQYLSGMRYLGNCHGIKECVTQKLENI